MHLGLNLLFLVPGETGGTETYAGELIPRLAAHPSGLQLTAFINEETAAAPPRWLEGLAAVKVPVRARRRAQWVWGEQALLPRTASQHRIELLHSLANTGPVYGPFTRVQTVHDLHFRLVSEAHLGINALGLRVLVPAAARRADRVIAVSRSTAADLHTLLGIPAERIDCVPEAARPRSAVAPTPPAALRQLLDAGDRPILLCVAAKRPHKNLERLIAAVGRFPPDARPLLVIPGYRTAYASELERRVSELGLSADVRLLGWVPDERLEGLYAAAACVVCPSLHEGFGLPVLEAMARGVPVACSSRGALGEIAGDAAQRFEPTSVTEIADAIRSVITHPSAAATLRERGLRRAGDFSWDRTADLTVRSYFAALS